MAEGSCLALSTYVLLLCCLLALACFPVVHSEHGVPVPCSATASETARSPPPRLHSEPHRASRVLLRGRLQPGPRYIAHCNTGGTYRHELYSPPPAGTHYKYSLKDIEHLVQQAEVFITHALTVPPPSPPPTISHTTWRTQVSDIWLVHALSHHPVAGHNVVMASHHLRGDISSPLMTRLCLAPPTHGTRVCFWQWVWLM
jgi:hypothetical protein